jgi:hypothetical protein
MPIGFASNCKIYLGEHLHYRDIGTPAWLLSKAKMGPFGREIMVFDEWPPWPVLGLGCLAFLVWGGLIIAGSVRIVRHVDRRALAAALLLASLAGAQAALIVLGRMNIRSASWVLAINSHYVYIGLLWTLAFSAVPIAFLQSIEGSAGVLVHRLSAALVVGLVLLAITNAFKVHRLNAEMAEGFAKERHIWRSLTQFFDAHQREPDFSYAVELDPTWEIRHYAEVVLPYVVDNHHVNRDQPKYVLWFENGVFLSAPVEDWRRKHPDSPGFYASFISGDLRYYVFEREHTYFAAPSSLLREFVYSPDPWHDPAFHGEPTLPLLLSWIGARTSMRKTND